MQLEPSVKEATKRPRPHMFAAVYSNSAEKRRELVRQGARPKL